MTHLDLFSGIGGFALAANWAGFTTVGFCEYEGYPRRVLARHWPRVPIHGDIRELDGSVYHGVTLITGGFPCQPFSVAGQQAGKADDRYLWPEMLRVIAQAQPDWVVAENVTGIINLALDQVLSDLEGEGYACGTVVLPACSVDAPHRRDRVWIVGNSPHLRRDGRTTDIGRTGQTGKQDKPGPEIWGEPGGPSEDVADAGSGPGPDWWAVEPDVGRVAHGIPRRVDRLKGLGNAIVPQVAYQIFKTIRGDHE